MATREEVPIIQTLIRTIILVVLTFIFVLILRTKLIAELIQHHILNLGFWKSLYSVLDLQTALAREQCMMSVLLILCFLVALIVEFSLFKLTVHLRARYIRS